jgi:CheY-like chemotaxis protein
MRWSYLVTEKEKGPETILIVDDDSEIREILRILLCRNGFIVKAADAKEALLKLDSSIDFFFC